MRLREWVKFALEFILLLTTGFIGLLILALIHRYKSRRRRVMSDGVWILKSGSLKKQKEVE